MKTRYTHAILILSLLFCLQQAIGQQKEISKQDVSASILKKAFKERATEIPTLPQGISGDWYNQAVNHLQ